MNGVFLIDKDKGCTSRDVVNEIIKKTETTRVGHTGTLDPLATGVLVICVGKATKLVDYLTSTNKTYQAEITLGLETDTLDIEGNILKEEIVNISNEEIIFAINSMKGRYEQEVPIYSAIKVKGKKLYDYARAGENVVLPKRDVEVFDINLISEIERINNRIIFSIECSVSKGTYIRSLARDIAFKLKTIGVMSALRRLKQGNFSIEECKTVDDIKLPDIIGIGRILTNIYKVQVDDILKKDILNGKIIKNIYDREEIMFVDSDDAVLAIYKIYSKDTTMIKPEIMIGGIK
jgi:tRNA pseudouridine 55 synthase